MSGIGLVLGMNVAHLVVKVYRVEKEALENVKGMVDDPVEEGKHNLGGVIMGLARVRHFRFCDSISSLRNGLTNDKIG